MINYTEIFERVIMPETFKSLDYANADIKAYEKFGGGMCSAVAKYTGGKMLVGRNMDLYICHKPAYLVRTAVEGYYKTVGLSFFHRSGPDYEDLKKSGIDDEFAKVLPFFCTDVLNEKGLYMETNMRLGERLDNGQRRYTCTGTNPASDKRVCSAILPRYVVERCADIDEAIEYVKTLNIYSPATEDMDWNFCFMLADASGRYGVMEIAQNEVSWLENQCCQTNFYLTDKFQKGEKYKLGLGRYEKLTSLIDDVKNEDDILSLIDGVSCFQVYHPDVCRFDYRAEYVGFPESWTTEFVLDEKNRDTVYKKAKEVEEKVNALDRKGLMDKCLYWESTFTCLVNCTDKTMRVRFFEDEEKVMRFEVE